MISTDELLGIASARIEDGRILSESGRYEASIYLSGYAVELALKARICETLDWPGYPSTNNEFQGYQSFRTHNLDVLLHLSGLETRVRTEMTNEWSVVPGWDPEVRYHPTGDVTEEDSLMMLDACRVLMGSL